MKKPSQAERLTQLALQNETLFHIKDLRAWWGIRNPNTLRMTLKRYADAGLLHRIYRGFYSLLPIEKLSPVELGQKALHRYAYLSTESVLYRDGYLSQAPSAYTFVSGKRQKFTIESRHFFSRSLPKKYLMNPAGLTVKNGLHVATPARAIADLLYFNPKVHFDKTIPWPEVKTIQEQMSYPLTPERYAAA